jgi:cytochrome c
MSKWAFWIVPFLFFVFSITPVFAKDHTPEDRGKAHFNNSAFAGGKKSCSTCHPNGRGLEGAGVKTAFSIMGGEQNSLEDVINVCIVNANKGNAIEDNSVEMQELVSYIRSLGTQENPGEGK